MNLKDKVSAAAKKVFNDLESQGGILSTIYYQQSVKGGYNPVTDSYSEQGRKIRLNAVKQSASKSELDSGFAQLNDIFFTILGDELGFDPVTTDSIFVNNKKYSIVGIDDNALGVIYVLQVRR